MSVAALVAGLVDVGIVLWISECAWLLLFELPSDDMRIVKVVGRARARLVRLAREPVALGRLAEAVLNLPDGEDLAVSIRESVDDVKARVARRLGVLRVLGPTASCVGLAGAAVQMSWLHADHGLLDLDPDRVLRVAVETGSLCMAFGVAGSAAAIGGSYFFRPRARALHRGLDRFAEVLAGEASRSWTAGDR